MGTQEVKHTPGPWQISRLVAGKTGTSHLIWRNDEGPNSPEDSGNTNYARICQHVHNEANARLIAAAPQMLQELKAIGHQTQITTEHFNRLQRLIESIEQAA